MIGTQLKKLRTERAFTQETVAAKLGIKRETYSHYENNKREPSVRLLLQLADLFQVSIDYLCGRTTDRNLHTEIDSDERLLIVHYRAIDNRAQFTLSCLADHEAQKQEKT